MVKDIALQMELGPISALNFLSCGAPILAALSADNVSNVAVTQMAQLGSPFHVNGRYAGEVAELLSRTSIHPVNRVLSHIGWRRGDTASFFHASAGGQAIALLSCMLRNIYSLHDTGDMLAELYENFNPLSAIPSPVHLANVADILCSKLNVIGYGSNLADRKEKLIKAYKHLGIAVPNGLFNKPCSKSIVGIFKCLKHLIEVDNVVRITGSEGMAHIFTIIYMMFPMTTQARVESCLIHEGPNPRIILEITNSDMIVSQVEKNIGEPPHFRLPIHPIRGVRVDSHVSFEYKGWLKKKLSSEFSDADAICTEEILVGCCDMMMQLAPKLKAAYPNKNSMPQTGLMGMLGQYPKSRIERICKEIFFASPSPLPKIFSKAWKEFVASVMSAVQCTCGDCQFERGWPSGTIYETQTLCPAYKLWDGIARILSAGLLCLAINTHGRVSISDGFADLDPARMLINKEVGGASAVAPTAKKYFNQVLSLVMPREEVPVGALACSSGSATIYPTVLKTLEVSHDGSFTFELVGGQFVYEGRYHRFLRSSETTRQPADDSIVDMDSEIFSSNMGDHMDIKPRLRESYHGLTLSLDAQVSGRFVQINVSHTIFTYIGLARTKSCQHSVNEPLSACYKHNAIVTGVEAPRSRRIKVLSIAMVRANRMAQFLCCAADSRCLLLQGCCLDCGYKQALDKFDILIVS